MLYVLKKDTPFCKWPLAQLEAHKVCSLESIYKWWNVKVTVECLTRAVWSSLECIIGCVLSALLETLCYKTLIARIKVVASLQCSATKQLNLECSEVLNTDLGNPHERVMCWRKCFIFISKDSERITLWLWLVFILRSLFKIWNFKETGCKPWGESEKQKSLAKKKKFWQVNSFIGQDFSSACCCCDAYSGHKTPKCTSTLFSQYDWALVSPCARNTR